MRFQIDWQQRAIMTMSFFSRVSSTLCQVTVLALDQIWPKFESVALFEPPHFMTGCLCLQKPSFSSHIVLQVLEFVNIVQLVSGWNQARFAFEKKTITTQFKLDMATTIISQYKNLWNKIQVKSEFGSDWKKSFDYSEIRGFAFC